MQQDDSNEIKRLKEELDHANGKLYAYEQEKNDPFKKYQQVRKENNLAFVVAFLCFVSAFFYNIFISSSLSLSLDLFIDNIVKTILYSIVLLLVSLEIILNGVFGLNKENNFIPSICLAFGLFLIFIILLMIV